MTIDAPVTVRISSKLGQRLALRAREHSVQNIRKPDELGLVPTRSVTPQELFNEFNSGGLSYRGKICTGFQRHERGAQLDASFDFGNFIAPGIVVLAVGGKGSYTGGDGALIVAENQGRWETGELAGGGLFGGEPVTDYVLCTACLTGVSRNWNVTFSAEAGFKTPSKKPLAECEFAEDVGWKVEAKATAGAQAGYDGKYIYVSSDNPQTFFYDSGWDDFKAAVIEVLIAPKKSELKAEIVDQINKLASQTGIDASLRRNIFGSRITRETLIGKILEIQKRSDLSQRLRSQLSGYIVRLQSYAPSEDAISSPAQTFVKLWGHKGAANAGLKAEATFKAEAGPVGFDVSAKAEALKIEGSIKRTSFRFQMEQPERIRRTQDTIIWYKQADFTPFTVKAEAAVSLGFSTGSEEKKNQTKTTGGFKGELELLGSGTKALHNSMRYSSATAFWRTPAAGEAVADDGWRAAVTATYDKISTRYSQSRAVDQAKFDRVLGLKEELLALSTRQQVVTKLKHAIGDRSYMINRSRNPFVGKTQTRKDLDGLIHELEGSGTPAVVQCLPGSGYAYGESILVSSVARIYELAEAGNLGPVGSFYSALAGRLRTTQQQVEAFFNDPECQSLVSDLLLDPGFKPGAVLLEATFQGPQMPLPFDGGEPHDLLKTFHDRLGVLPDNTRRLQSIRLRYRIIDREGGKAKDRFTLGIKFGETKLGITLLEAEEAGSDGIVDLFVKWYEPALAMLRSERLIAELTDTPYKETPQALYDNKQIVPAVTLLHQ